ncbi:protein SUPPRESSOR OF MAX2 1 [Senna tora]|uniref:Protein SUPPRESSOR OF MAX2 1 n=1 Tax=Senna tora TaxID=362788 RepID=A0A834X5F2_9FABA|nr:protein SUPPRESSOR OF MAX2 1 [Senna tora]
MPSLKESEFQKREEHLLVSQLLCAYRSLSLTTIMSKLVVVNLPRGAWRGHSFFLPNLFLSYYTISKNQNKTKEMRAGLSTIHQTLTPEAATVLNQSIGEAGRRNHGQTTPLHVAATLLASPSGFLRQACIKSHPNSSHPLQCRALELCFSVALERLPTSQSRSPGMEPPISNALMAALKRAQAHQRRGCPEQQQQPLLAVKVELQQLIISILDDPSVSRVMREASFSSPAVKSTIEQTLNTSSPSSSSTSTVTSNSIGLGFRPRTVAPAAAPCRNLYLNPRLQQGINAAQLGQQRGEEVKRIIDIMMRTKKRNPILVGESEPECVVKEVLRKIESKEMGDLAFNNAHVILLEKELPSDKAQIPARLKEVGDLIESRIGNPSSGSGGVLVNLGDLKWLVEQPVGAGVSMQQQAFTEAGRAIVAEMRRLVTKLGESGRLWLIGTATCETYLRCQVYHPSMENDWDLQAVPIAARAPLPQTIPRLGTNGILGVSLEPLSPLKGFPTATVVPRYASENVDPAQTTTTTCCPQCMQSCEQEVEDMLKEIENADFDVRSEAAKPQLPQWLQNVKNQTQSDNKEVTAKKKTQELQKKWQEACMHLHPKFHQQNLSSHTVTPTPFSMMSLYNPNLMGRQSQPKLELNKNLACSLQLSSTPAPARLSDSSVSPPGSPVTTELVLSSESQKKQSNKLLDPNSFKKLLKGLTEKVWWQQDAAAAIATTVTQCKMGNGKRRGGAPKGDTWLLFLGPDRASKKKMAAALSELVSGCPNPIVISLGGRRGIDETDVQVRGKTALDRIAEAIRRNPFSVIMLENMDEADLLIRGSIKRAMEQGRFCDSHGREISLGNVMFILTSNWLPENLRLRYSSNVASLDEEKLVNSARRGWKLRLSVAKKTEKRGPGEWLSSEERPCIKARKEIGSSLAFDLNEAADADEDRADGSMNSSDITVDHEDNQDVLIHNIQYSSSLSPTTQPISRELLDGVDDAIVFNPVDFGTIGGNFTDSVTKIFSKVIGSGTSIEVQKEALEKIAGGVWLGETGMEEWIEKALVPSLHELKRSFSTRSGGDESLVVRLEDDDRDICDDSIRRSCGDLLPRCVRVVTKWT